MSTVPAQRITDFVDEMGDVLHGLRADVDQKRDKSDPTGPAYLTAAEAIVSGQLVGVIAGQAVGYDVSKRNHAYTLVGIAQTSAQTGSQVEIATGPNVHITSWGLTPGATYRAGLSGQLITGNEASGATFSQVIGRATTADDFIFRPQFVINKPV